MSGKNICPFCKVDLNKNTHVVGIPHPQIMSIHQAFGNEKNPISAEEARRAEGIANKQLAK